MSPLDALRARAEEVARFDREATPGPWEACLGSGHNVCTALNAPPQGRGSHPLVADFAPDYFADEELGVSDHVPNLCLVEHYRTACPRWAAAAVLLAEFVEAEAREADAFGCECDCDCFEDGPHRPDCDLEPDELCRSCYCRRLLAQAVRIVEGEVRDA